MDTTQNIQISIIQAATFSRVISYINSSGDPIDLTGYTATMIFRETLEDTEEIITLSTEDDSIVIDEDLGTITFTISSTITATLTNGMKLVYNLFIYAPSNVVTPLLGGTAIVIGSTIR